MLRGEESPEQRKRTLPPLDQRRFGVGADFRVPGLQAADPISYQGGIFGEAGFRLRWR